MAAGAYPAAPNQLSAVFCPGILTLAKATRDTMNDRAHLLIVDDDREIRGLLAQYLENHDFRDPALADSKEMRRLMECSPVDLVVLDLMLPGEDGLSLCRELRG